MKTVKLIKCPGSNAMIELHRAGDTDIHLLGITEFGHTYSISWYEVRSDKLSQVLERFGTDEFEQEFSRNRKAYARPIKAGRNLRRDKDTLELLLDINEHGE